MKRRTVLGGAAASAAGFFSGAASAADNTAASPASRIFPRHWRSSAPRSRRISTGPTSRTPSSRSFSPASIDGERPALPMIDVTLTKENALPARPLGADLRRTGSRLPRKASPSSSRAWRSAATTICASGSTCPRSRPTCTGRCTAPRSSRSSTGCSTRNSPASRSCGTISTTTGISTGTCTSA